MLVIVVKTVQDSLEAIRSLRSPVRVLAGCVNDAALAAAFQAALADIIGVQTVHLEQTTDDTTSFLVDTISPGALLTSLRRLPQFPVAELQVADGEVTVQLLLAHGLGAASKPPAAPECQLSRDSAGSDPVASPTPVTESQRPSAGAGAPAFLVAAATEQSENAAVPTRNDAAGALPHRTRLRLPAIMLAIIVAGGAIVFAQGRRSDDQPRSQVRPAPTVAAPVPVSLATAANAEAPAAGGSTTADPLVNAVDVPLHVAGTPVAAAAPAAPPTPTATDAAVSATPGSQPPAAVLQPADLPAAAVLAALQQQGIAISERTDADASRLPGAAVATVPQPTSRVLFADDGPLDGSTAQGPASGGAIEVFATAEDAEGRRAYLQRIGAVVPAVAERDERVGAVLLRLSADVTPAHAATYIAALHAALPAQNP